MLQVRGTDRGFFEANVLTSFLPTRYHLSGFLERQEASDGAEGRSSTSGTASSGAAFASNASNASTVAIANGTASSVASSSGGDGSVSIDGAGGSSAGGDSVALENETWWRLYRAADCIRGELEGMMEEGLNLQVRRW